MKILSIAKYDLLKLLRDRTSLVIIIAIPLIFTFVMGLAYGSADSAEVPKISVGIANNDNSELVSKLIENIKNDNTINVVEMSEEVLLQKVRSSGVEAGFIIPYDFTEKSGAGEAEIKVLNLPASAGYVAAEASIRAAFAKMNIKEAAEAYFKDVLEDSNGADKELIISNIVVKVGEKLEEPSPITVSDVRVSGEEESSNFNGKAHSSIGISVMFVMFAVILGAGEILEEKKNKTWGRLAATPTNMATITLGKILGTFLRGWFQVSFLILFGRFVLGVSWGNSIFASILLISVYLLCLTGLGVFLSTLVQTNAQLGSYSSILIISTSMLAGCYWPLDIVPEFMQKIAMVLPQYWAVKGLNNTVNANMGISSIFTHISVLVIMGVVFFSLSIISERISAGKNKISAAPVTHSA